MTSAHRSLPFSMLAAFAVTFLFVVGAAFAATLAPSDLIANADKYDKQKVTVAGKVAQYQVADTPKGSYAFYQLCDTKCVQVIDAKKPGFQNGQNGKASGQFLKHFTGPRRSFTNVVIIQ